MFRFLPQTLISALMAVTVVSTSVAATTNSCEIPFTPEQRPRSWEQNLQYPDYEQGWRGDPHDQPTFAESIMEMAFRAHFNETLARTEPRTAERLKRAYLYLEDEAMPLDRGGFTPRWGLPHKNNILLNLFTKGSPLYWLTVAHELAHASRFVTFFGKFERVWNYQIVNTEETEAALVEYRILRRVAEDVSLNAFERALNNRYIHNRHINRHRVEWHKRGWIDDDGKPTSSADSLLIDLLTQSPDKVHARVSSDPSLKSYLVHVYDLEFLRHLKLALSTDEETYVFEHLKGYADAAKRYAVFLKAIHAVWLVSLGTGAAFILK